MKGETFNFEFFDKKIKLKIFRTGLFSKILGLMLRSSGTRNLLFEFKKETLIPIHSLFVFFPFLIIWFDSRNKVLDFKIVRPFTSLVKPKTEFRKFIEVPFNDENKEIIDFFVGKLERFK